MKVQKIRGHNRRQKQIRRWIDETKQLNLKELFEWRREYAEILIHPWSSGSSIIESIFPEPYGRTKALMLEGLLEIYNSWKIELDKLNKPYYLKIWLYEPRFSRSQVVCAIDDKIAHYENLFNKPDKHRTLNLEVYGNLKNKLLDFEWIAALDEEIHSESDFNFELKDYSKPEHWTYNQRLFRRIKNNPRTKIEAGDEETGTLYCVPKGLIWLGSL